MAKSLLVTYDARGDAQEMQRHLGETSGISVSALGAGCWAIGGPWQFDGRPAGWGSVDDDDSIHAIHTAVDLGITLFDTADVYGCGHSERVLGRALAGHRDEVVISTKFGLRFDEATRTGSGTDVSPEYVRRACEASLRRLGTDRIDLYQLHGGAEDRAAAAGVVEVLEALVAEGKIRFYGTANEAFEVVEAFAEGPHCVAVQQQLNVFGGNDAAIAACEERGLAALARSPLAMGLLTGKYRPGGPMPADDDVRRDTPHWDYFDDGAMECWTQKLEAIRQALTQDGRTLAQGSLAWIWAYSPVAIPIPGFKTAKQVEENAGAMRFGPLSEAAMGAIDDALGRPTENVS
jgi:aryl-alcohol dehydrogenase-like predicted oxidoreductase